MARERCLAGSTISRRWIAAIDPGDLKVQWQAPWHEIGRQALPGVVLLRASRLP